MNNIHFHNIFHTVPKHDRLLPCSIPSQNYIFLQMWEYRAAAKEDNFHSRAQKKIQLTRSPNNKDLS